MLAPSTSLCACGRATLLRRRRASSVTRSSLAHDDDDGNPQNVPPPLVLPSTLLSVEECVRVQLEAAQRNHEPRPSHGVHVLYEFCASAGSMERSRYFGISKDLYHLGACGAGPTVKAPFVRQHNEH